MEFVGCAIHLASHHPELWSLDPQSILPRLATQLRWSDVGIPFGALGALGGALAIFLGFRNNTAYDRWWEARKIWGGLVNDSRSWCRQVLAFVDAPDNHGPTSREITDLQREFVHRHLAFVHGLALHLRKKASLPSKVAEFVADEEAQRHRAAPNIPTSLLIEQGRRLAEVRAGGQLEHFRHFEMDGLLTRLSDIQGKCERIKNTPLPRQYDVFPKLFTYFYAAMLPFGLAPPLGWGAVPISVIIGVLFLGLDASGRFIEDPFEDRRLDTPMTALSVTIERDLRAALGEPLPESIKPDAEGVVM